MMACLGPGLGLGLQLHLDLDLGFHVDFIIECYVLIPCERWSGGGVGGVMVVFCGVLLALAPCRYMYSVLCTLSPTD